MNTVENRPAIYFAGLTDEELISYAVQYAVTALEIQLLQRLEGKKCGPDSNDVCQCCGSSI